MLLDAYTCEARSERVPNKHHGTISVYGHVNRLAGRMRPVGARRRNPGIVLRASVRRRQDHRPPQSHAHFFEQDQKHRVHTVLTAVGAAEFRVREMPGAGQNHTRHAGQPTHYAGSVGTGAYV